METTTVSPAAAPVATRTAWPLERILFLLAGSMTMLSALLSAVVSPWFLLLAAFVAANQLAFASIGHCGASLILERVFGVKRSAKR